MFKEKIKPPLVLTIICIIACILLVLAYEATYVDNAGVITDKMILGLDEIYGSSNDFSILKNADDTVKTYDGVTSVLATANGLRAYEITTDGYNSGGLHVLVGFDENDKIKGIYILTISETPGLGTKVQDDTFLSQFIGLDESNLSVKTDDGIEVKKVKAKAVWGTDEEISALMPKAADTETHATQDHTETDVDTGATAHNEKDTDTGATESYTKADADTGATAGHEEAPDVNYSFNFDVITGATYSSNGIYHAVEIALQAHSEKEAG